MEYVVLRAVHPSRLVTQLPREVADLLGFPTRVPLGPTDSRSISFLGRGEGLIRVVASYPVREAIALESIRGTLLGSAQFGEKFIFSLPAAVLHHLSMEMKPPGSRGGRATQDSMIWFLPAPEYYLYRSATADGSPWENSPGSEELPHIYLARSRLPLPPGWSDLYERDCEIESRVWAPSLHVLRRIGGRRGISATAVESDSRRPIRSRSA